MKKYDSPPTHLYHQTNYLGGNLQKWCVWIEDMYCGPGPQYTLRVLFSGITERGKNPEGQKFGVSFKAVKWKVDMI